MIVLAVRLIECLEESKGIVAVMVDLLVVATIRFRRVSFLDI
jgi:hypothetical protein